MCHCVSFVEAIAAQDSLLTIKQLRKATRVIFRLPRTTSQESLSQFAFVISA